MTNRIDMEAIGKSFFATRALDNVDFSCAGGEVHALVGLNGAGKSTLMKILGGVYQADEGRILRNGEEVKINAPADAAAQGISMIHQELSLINELTVAGNIFLGQELRRPGTPFLDKKEMARRVRAQLERFGLDLDPNRPVRELNSGEKQIVEIIRALMSDSWLIVMDEPTSALSEEDKTRLFTFIERMTAESIAIIYISHHMPEIFGIADRVTVMRDGRIVLSEATADTREDAVIATMTGKELEDFVKPHKEITGDVLLSVQDLHHEGRYGPVSFDVHRGEIVVMTGLRGCGAPEMAKAIFGLDGGYTGKITYRGAPLVPGSGPAKAVRSGMGLVTENRDKNGILAPLSVRDNIALPFLEKSVKGGVIDAAAVETLVEKAIRDTSTKTSSPDQEIRFLSGGNKQKICFSRWLDPDLELLILLEPTRGIDVHAKADIYRIIEDLAARGVGILVLSYEIDEVIMLADRVLTLYQGLPVDSYAYPNFEKDRMLADMAGARSM
ncbi:sugar ABC transporter ATP-binding protein [Pseudoruegeria sp. SHC-113]|uniref:sugar ABC transporter ATP-binding protein n=1 Tax=Pseudoruegeria sp. SHC-113 TaxID=2855439 RepID=UPI0021BB2B38|nr:sugar ABC transporter ATP-binding protein [Pseudoruegeria sp. SHC-113]MCT8161721.1 sugar ABC transporter ATP-binding protein [Pseudoruegeria sp. SHC-113]